MYSKTHRRVSEATRLFFETTRNNEVNKDQNYKNLSVQRLKGADWDPVPSARSNVIISGAHPLARLKQNQNQSQSQKRAEPTRTKTVVDNIVSRFEFDDLEVKTGGGVGNGKGNEQEFIPRKKLEFTSQQLYLRTKYGSDGDLGRLRENVKKKEQDGGVGGYVTKFIS